MVSVNKAGDEKAKERVIKYLLEQYPLSVPFPKLLTVYCPEHKTLSQKEREKYKKRLQRFLNRLCSEGLLSKEVHERISYFAITRQGAVAHTHLILKRGTRKTQTQSPNEFMKWVKSINRYDKDYFAKLEMSFARKVRIQALNLCLNEKSLNPELKEELIGYFLDYLEDISDKRLLFLDENGEPHVLEYLTRFNSKRKAKQYKRKYKHIWRLSAERYKWAVHVTLTIDPAKVQNLYEARVKAQEAWNRFITWLKKDKGRKLEYIRFNEYQQNGRMHVHAVIFGIRGLGKRWKEFKDKHWGMGFISTSRLVNKRGKWVYVDVPKDYDERVRKKYLHAEPSAYFYFNLPNGEVPEDDYDLLQLALHWALNTRFFTNSSMFNIPRPQKEPSGWVFIRSFYQFEESYLSWLFDTINYDSIYYIENKGLASAG